MIKNIILPENYTTEYNGVKVKWFIGDINSIRVEKLNCFSICKNKTYKEVKKRDWLLRKKKVLVFDGFVEGKLINKEGAYWEAWGSCNGKTYQLNAWFDRETRELSDITIHGDKNNYYYDAETYKMLTK